ncbi:MAG: phytanoyl-CoA dioxygenase family protein [Chthonomonadales bacterium]|nr:phytanoyl-CoA dioxygenase family protein [Chthonomonadales bacterium]
MEVLSQEQVEGFRRDGYLRFGRVLDAAGVQGLREALARAAASAHEPGADLPPEFAYGHEAYGARSGRRAIHQYLNLWKVAPEYRAVVDHPAITGVVRDLMGARAVRIWHDQVISKPPGDNKHFQCHHDFYFWPLDRPTMITCWLALDDASVDNGCMHVVPRSHRDPRYQPASCDLSPDIQLEPAPGGRGEPGSLYDEIRTWMPDRAVPVELAAGECMFHHCLNYHMTPENRTDRQRRAFVIIYMPDGSRYNPAQSPNHPCAHYLGLEDGAPMGGPAFPICGAPES